MFKWVVWKVVVLEMMQQRQDRRLRWTVTAGHPFIWMFNELPASLSEFLCTQSVQRASSSSSSSSWIHQVTALSSSTKWNHCSSQNCRHAPSTHFLSWFMVPPASVVLNPDFTPHRSCAAVTGSIDLMEDILRSLHHNRPDRQRGGAVQRSVRGHPCFHQRLRLQRLNIQSKSVETLLFKPIRSVNSASQTVSRADTLSRLYSSRKWVCGASRRRIALHAFHFGM